MMMLKWRKLIGCSQTSLPTNSSVQANAASWCWDKGSGCEMGQQSELVFPYVVWVAACVQLYLGKQ
jgi:hypothetical protein